MLGWYEYKWLNDGPKVRITAQNGMKVVGGRQIDPKTYVSVTAVNYGNNTTMITNMGFLYYTTWFNVNLRCNRTDKAFINTTFSSALVMSYRFEAGAEWIGMADQIDDVNQMIREGYLFVQLYFLLQDRVSEPV